MNPNPTFYNVSDWIIVIVFSEVIQLFVILQKIFKVNNQNHIRFCILFNVQPVKMGKVFFLCEKKNWKVIGHLTYFPISLQDKVLSHIEQDRTAEVQHASNDITHTETTA